MPSLAPLEVVSQRPVEVAADVVTFLHKLVNLLDGVDEKPWPDAVLRIGDTVLQNVDRLFQASDASHSCANRSGESFPVRLEDSAVPLRNMIWDEDASAKLRQQRRVKSNMEATVNIDADEVAGTGYV